MCEFGARHVHGHDLLVLKTLCGVTDFMCMLPLSLATSVNIKRRSKIFGKLKTDFHNRIDMT